MLILDEPTAVLTPQETDQLLEVLRELADQGGAIVFITHKLREVLAIADEVTVMRDGRVVGSTTPGDTAEAGLAEAFVHGTGHGVGLDIHEAPALSGSATGTLRSGHVVTVEPGAYLAGLGGVRWEDTVLVTDDGHPVLTLAPRAD